MAILCFVNISSNAAYSSVAPFYPNVAAKKGVDPSYIGFIFAGYSSAMVLMSPFYAPMLNGFGRKKVLMLGCFC